MKLIKYEKKGTSRRLTLCGIKFSWEKSKQKNENSFFVSSEYWENKYLNSGNSGVGSYGRLADFKAEIINNFVEENSIENVIEFGCGDGHQLSLFRFKYYLGFDVSDTILKLVKKMFKNKKNYSFYNLNEYSNQKAELTLSLDVIFHLVEDDIFEKYMQNLFNASDKFVIIYSSNQDKSTSAHVRQRKFSDWIEKNKTDWILIKKIPNKFPFDINNQNETSFADFYIYKKGDEIL